MVLLLYLRSAVSFLCCFWQHVRKTCSEGVFDGNSGIIFSISLQNILAYSWARPAILVAGRGRGGMFLFLLILHFHSCSSFFPVHLFHLFYFSSIYFLSFSGRQFKMTHMGWRVIKPQHNQSTHKYPQHMVLGRNKNNIPELTYSSW